MVFSLGGLAVGTEFYGLPGDMTKNLMKLAAYELGQSQEPLIAIDEYVRSTRDSALVWEQLERRFAAMLGSDASPAAKIFMCRQLSIIGTTASVPVLSTLLQDGRFSYGARRALQCIAARHSYEALSDLLKDSRNNSAEQESQGAETKSTEEDRDALSVELHEAVKKPDLERVEALLNKGANVNARDSLRDNWTPLHWAAYKGHEAVAVLLVRRGADVSARESKNGGTPLHYAVHQGHYSTVRVLVQHAAPIDARTMLDALPIDIAEQRGYKNIADFLRSCVWTLHEAAGHGDIGRVNHLVESGVDIDGRDAQGRTALHIAAEMGNEDLALTVLEKGVAIDAVDCNDDTALHRAVAHGHSAVIELLLAGGADTEVKNSAKLTASELDSKLPGTAISEIFRKHDGGGAGSSDMSMKPPAALTSKSSTSTSLIQAITDDDELAVKRIMSALVNVDGRDAKGATALHYAVRRGNLDVVMQLLAKNADINTYTLDGITPLHVAADAGLLEIAAQLAEKGADVDAREKHGLTPLHLAILKGHIDLVQLLLARGVNYNAREQHGATPLHLACFRGHLEIVKLLLARDIEVDAGNERGATPLHEAASGGYQNVVVLLLAHTFDARIEDNAGWMPCDYASQQKHSVVTKCLEEYGGK